MRSGWFWNTPQWQEYLKEYSQSRPECLHEWKSSPLANDHDFTEEELSSSSTQGCNWEATRHLSQVIDMRTHKWSDIRKSYRGLINKALKEFSICEYKEHSITWDMDIFKDLHVAANGGQPRNDQTYAYQRNWMVSGNGMLVLCTDWPFSCAYAGAYWIIYKDAAYYMSGPSLLDDLQHAVIWKSLQLLKERGINLVELGQIDGETEKERNIGKFKAGFGGEARPFTIVRRI